MSAAPQLGGLFAGGMPKLRKTGAGVDTGGMSNALQPRPWLFIAKINLHSEPRVVIPLRPGIISAIGSETACDVCTKTTTRRSTCNCRPAECCECG
jgi:hypothetical protein